MPKHNPTTLQYEAIHPGNGPKFGVSDSQSSDFYEGAARVYAWFCHADHARQFTQHRIATIWDLEEATIVSP